MSWEQIGNSIKFIAFFVATKVGKTGLADVTVDVYNPAGVEVVTAAAATVIGDGFYSYTLALGSVATEGEYLAVFKTADATVDQQHIPALWIVGRAGVEFQDASIAARTAGLVQRAEPPTAAANATELLDHAAAAHVTAGTVGKLINMIGVGDFTVSMPVSSDGTTLALVRSDDYYEADGRHLSFASSDWPDLTGATEIKLTVRRRAEAFTAAGEDVLFAVTDKLASRVTGAGAQTVVFELPTASTALLLVGTATGKYDIQAKLITSAHIITLVTGLVNVTEDQTR